MPTYDLYLVSSHNSSVNRFFTVSSQFAFWLPVALAAAVVESIQPLQPLGGWGQGADRMIGSGVTDRKLAYYDAGVRGVILGLMAQEAAAK